MVSKEEIAQRLKDLTKAIHALEDLNSNHEFYVHFCSGAHRGALADMWSRCIAACAQLESLQDPAEGLPEGDVDPHRFHP